ICDVVGVTFFYYLQCAEAVAAYSVHKRIISQLHTFPSFIPVHGIISSGNRGDFSSADEIDMILQIFDEPVTTSGISVPAISKRMDENIGNRFRFTAVNNCLEMIDMGMHTAITHEADKMQFFVFGFRLAHGLKKYGIFCKRSVTDGNIDPLKFLVYDSAGANIQMAY